jgi:hypothetical protein
MPRSYAMLMLGANKLKLVKMVMPAYMFTVLQTVTVTDATNPDSFY